MAIRTFINCQHDDEAVPRLMLAFAEQFSTIQAIWSEASSSGLTCRTLSGMAVPADGVLACMLLAFYKCKDGSLDAGFKQAVAARQDLAAVREQGLYLAARNQMECKMYAIYTKTSQEPVPQELQCASKTALAYMHALHSISQAPQFAFSHKVNIWHMPQRGAWHRLCPSRNPHHAASAMPTSMSLTGPAAPTRADHEE